ncbi:response regulator [bacterium]
MGKQAKILIVDDTETTRTYLRGILEKEGYEIVGEAADGEEAVEMNRELEPDLVLMDNKMERMNGVDAARIIRKDTPGRKVIILTATAQPSTVTESFKAGAVNFIIMPCEPIRLLRAVRNVV